MAPLITDLMIPSRNRLFGRSLVCALYHTNLVQAFGAYDEARYLKAHCGNRLEGLSLGFRCYCTFIPLDIVYTCRERRKDFNRLVGIIKRPFHVY